MKKKWKILLCVSLAVALLCGVLAVWLWEREPQGDTDPNAPFADLPDRTKKEVLDAIGKEYPYRSYGTVFWYGDEYPVEVDEVTKEMYRFDYGVRYYGTFNGYHIVIAPIVSLVGMPQACVIGDYTFDYLDSFRLFAYQDGMVTPLEEAYKNGILSKEQIGLIHQCYERFNDEIYPCYDQRTEKADKENYIVRWVLPVCCGVALASAGYGVLRFFRKQRIGPKSRRMIPKERIRKIAICTAVALAMLGSVLTIWLVSRPPEDTDPNAPFRDLPRWTKERVMSAIEKKLADMDYEAFWYGDAAAERQYGSQVAHSAGVRYYGTFNGYHIVMAPLEKGAEENTDICKHIGIYDFHYDLPFEMFAYKDGVVVYLADAYEEGLLENVHIFQIYHIFYGDNSNIYTVPSEEETVQ